MLQNQGKNYKKDRETKDKIDYFYEGKHLLWNLLFRADFRLETKTKYLMKTDYTNLNTFEVLVVMFIMIGAMLVAIISFSGLTPAQQSHVTMAFNILDMHEQAPQIIQSTENILDIPGEFYNQFYLAFTQVAVVDLNPFEYSGQSLLDYADRIALNYSSQNLPDNQMVDQTLALDIDVGKVLGVSFDLIQDSPVVKNCRGEPQAGVVLVPYSYQEPKINLTKLIGSISFNTMK